MKAERERQGAGTCMLPSGTPASAGACTGLWNTRDPSEFIQPQGQGAGHLFFCTSWSVDGLLCGAGSGQLQNPQWQEGAISNKVCRGWGMHSSPCGWSATMESTTLKGFPGHTSWKSSLAHPPNTVATSYSSMFTWRGSSSVIRHFLSIVLIEGLGFQMKNVRVNIQKLSFCLACHCSVT